MHGICLVCFIDCCFLFLDLLWCLLITRHLNSAYLWILLLCHVVPLQLWIHVRICLVLLFAGFLTVVKPPWTQETIHYMFGSRLRIVVVSRKHHKLQAVESAAFNTLSSGYCLWTLFGYLPYLFLACLVLCCIALPPSAAHHCVHIYHNLAKLYLHITCE